MILIKILFGLMGLSLVVVIHEAGHFIAARKTGITVEAFSIGWGKILYRKMRKGTEFRISLLPLGGYCKMQGEQAMIQAWESKARSIDSMPGDMYGASWWKRIIVSISGPLMNLIFALLIFFFISIIGYNMHYYPSRIVLASEYTGRADYPADKAGLQSGDLITSINGKEIHRFDELQEAIVLHAEEKMDLLIERGHRIVSVAVIPELNVDSGAGYLGIYPWITAAVKTIDSTSPFLNLGLEEDDLILTVNDMKISHALELSQILSKENIKEIKVKRNGSELLLKSQESEGLIIEEAGIQFDYLSSRSPAGNPFYSLKDAMDETYSTVKGSIKGLTLLFKGINLQSAVSGPLRITYMTGEFALTGFKSSFGEGLLSFFRFIALINIALFIMNLLPIPVLDGGQILLFLVEGISRKKPNPAVLYRYQMIGTIFVFGLIILATMNDIIFISRN